MKNLANSNPSSNSSEEVDDESKRMKKMFDSVDSNSYERAEAAAARDELVVVERELTEAESKVKTLEEDDFSGTRYGGK